MIDGIKAHEAAERLFGLLHPIFRDCVEPFGSRRYDGTTPHVVDGFVYATDGTIAVRSPATPEVEAAAADVPPFPGAKRLPAEKVFPAEPIRGLEPRPAPTPRRPRVCPHCGCTPDAHDPRVVAPGVLLGADYAETLARHGAVLYLPDPAPTPGVVRFLVGDVEGVVARLPWPEPAAPGRAEP